METHRRSIVKALTWRIIATATTAILVLVFTGNWVLVSIVGGLDLVIKLLVYYGHERIWDKISWHRK
jgi:adenylylsulfate kinase